jgi:hypothetical protein
MEEWSDVTNLIADNPAAAAGPTPEEIVEVQEMVEIAAK